MNTPITYTVNTAHTKAETTLWIEACNTVLQLVSDSLSPTSDLWEVLLLGSNFTFQYDISFGNTDMKFIANVESKKMAAAGYKYVDLNITKLYKAKHCLVMITSLVK